jgi:Uma2 family endonuclease
MKSSRTRAPKTTEPLPLANGDHLNQTEFHRRYETHPEDAKFELVGGTVHMASPLKWDHGSYQPELTLVLMVYKAATPGVGVADNTTTILGPEGEPQPDLMLRILDGHGGQSAVNPRRYVQGAPELIVEVADSTRSIDLHGKRRDYLAAGVQEYVVWCVEEQQLYWFHFPSKRQLKADSNGIWKSRVFPGLWLNGTALATHDSARLIVTVQAGIASPAHAAFVRRLQKSRE